METVTAPVAERAGQPAAARARLDKPPMKETKEKSNRLWAFARRRPILAAALLAIVLGAPYWLLFASDRYVSEAHVVVQQSDLAGKQAVDFSTLLGGNSANKTDQLLLRDYLLSMDMSRALDKRLNLREHYGDTSRDPFSRFWFKNGSFEWFHQHYLSRVSVELDEYSGVLVIKTQAYEPGVARAMAQALVAEGERFMNQMANSVAQRQVTFLEQQVTSSYQRALRARQSLVEFQNRKGMVSPQETATALSTVVARLEAQRIELEAQRRALQAYLQPGHANIVQLDQQIAALDKQIDVERGRLASPRGQALNRTVEEYQRLEMEATFLGDVYKTSLTALEAGRVEATRTIKQVSVIQAPTQPEYPLEPRRIYNTVLLMLVVLLLAGVANLLVAIVRDHKD